MKTVFNAPVYWAENAVGTGPKFWLLIALQAVGFVYIGFVSEWRYYVIVFASTGLALPIYYLIALRGTIKELREQRTQEMGVGDPPEPAINPPPLDSRRRR